MSKTNADEIVRALETEVLCETCPHNGSSCPDDSCHYIMAADLIKSLQAQVRQKTSEAEGMRLNWYKCIENLKASQRRVRAAVEDMKYYLENNEENGVVYVPKFVVERIIKQRGPQAEKGGAE